MSNTIMGRRKGTIPPAVIVLALVPVALVVIATLFGVLFPATPEQAAPTLAQCRTIGEAHDRLACYDRLEGKPLPLPAKGGQAVAP
jgi:hypothetical protein